MMQIMCTSCDPVNTYIYIYTTYLHMDTYIYIIGYVCIYIYVCVWLQHGLLKGPQKSSQECHLCRKLVLFCQDLLSTEASKNVDVDFKDHLRRRRRVSGWAAKGMMVAIGFLD